MSRPSIKFERHCPEDAFNRVYKLASRRHKHKNWKKEKFNEWDESGFANGDIEKRESLYFMSMLIHTAYEIGFSDGEADINVIAKAMMEGLLPEKEEEDL